VTDRARSERPRREAEAPIPQPLATNQTVISTHLPPRGVTQVTWVTVPGGKSESRERPAEDMVCVTGPSAGPLLALRLRSAAHTLRGQFPR
jgi:hypothetical protein